MWKLIKNSLIAVLFIQFSFSAICNAQIDERIVRITSSRCEYNSKTKANNYLTGFLVKENGRTIGIMTALHGVCGCQEINADVPHGKNTFGKVTVTKVDVERDIALLTSERFQDSKDGFELLNNDFRLADEEVRMIGYRHTQDFCSVTRGNIRNPDIVFLQKLVPQNIAVSLDKRKSPDLNIKVIYLQMDLVQGSSGAPIIYNGKVVGIANGGIDLGRTGDCWAIPVKDINLQPYSPSSSRIENIIESNKNNLFSLTLDLDNIEERSPFERNMIEIKGGKLQMGSNDEEADKDEKPIHNVDVKDFYISKYEVTQADWKKVKGSYHSNYNGNCVSCPVENITFNEVMDFINSLNSKYSGKDYRLPTEEEWEYAARGGIYSRRSKYSGSNNINQVGWVSDNKIHPVGKLNSNELGLHDMSGNVWEFCSDIYGPYPGAKPNDPPYAEGYQVVRGGSYIDIALGSRVSNRGTKERDVRENGTGFRLARNK